MKPDVLAELRTQNPVPDVPPPPPFGPLLARLEQEPPVDGRQRPTAGPAGRRASAWVPALVSVVIVTAIAVGALALLHAPHKPLATGVAPSLATGSRVRVWIANGNNGQDVSNGGVSGRGRFKATGAITDTGTVVTYRTVTLPGLITLRYVTRSTQGTITYVVKINTATGTSRWTITSATGRYKGLHGRGDESENANYTISILTGTIWR